MKKGFLLLLIATLAFSSEREDAVAKMMAEFENSKQQTQQEFSSYKKQLNREFTAYKKEIGKYWKNPKLSTKKSWVSYTKDSKSRSEVDFDKNSYTIEVIAPNLQQAKKKMDERIIYIATKNTKQVVATDPLQKRIAHIPYSPEVISSPVDTKPILTTVLFHKNPTKEDVAHYAKRTLNNATISVKKAKQKRENIYKIVVQLPKNTTLKRAMEYKEDVAHNAQKFQLSNELIFAIIQTESNFNPFAKSHIPAFGLMQIVPHSAGKDAYKFIYHVNKIPSATYLYNGKNNIEMGSAYLHILYYHYLRKIRNPQSRLYCTIAAYNTGAGNIAWAFTHHYNLNIAAPQINALTPEEVYRKLLQNLRFDEPKYYLKRVKKRMKVYQSISKE